jgi:hypothetical protein
MERQLRIGRVAHFNDPFEGLLGDECVLPPPHQALSLQLPKILRDLANEKYGILSLSAITDPAEHPLMWSQYASHHGGAALGFRKPALSKLGLLLQVNYTPSRPCFNIPNMNKNLGIAFTHLQKGLPESKSANRSFKRIFGCKAKIWELEKEERLIVNLPRRLNSHSYLKIPRNALAHIFIGASSRLKPECVHKLGQCQLFFTSVPIRNHLGAGLGLG